ncbi:polysaccharide deacetylase family protein [Urechidicola vernalis]|uniref:Polysaccharide deacetylase family protein n=1 Tax=Urechidicola vernalis TaxID=3075600 RepID=A0ABU2Y439_9FLAO|nr:polysaccharide deacetylase family protein [Urechidicola sp. P050]MDT0552969.1 polysaccharide deacetylase family protein [Urechidicola sp. P050]
MKAYFVKTPHWIQRLFKNWVWSFSTSKKEIYLTFDDGPTPEITEWTLTELAKFNAKATFFCIGKNVKKYPDIFQKIIEQGHSIGNHTHNHLNGWNEQTEEYLNNSEKAALEIDSKLFRPPYGKLKLSQAKKLRTLGYKIIMWDVLSADFDQSISKDKCLENVLKNTQNGSVIIFHDSLKAAKNLKFTLPKVLEAFTKKGYSFKAIN